ncbi:MAG TPA: hypothetical protein VKL19_08095 [Thermoanaerobaculia bacterium]|nr:hypothetical protein [Thermoanaerobaculia bacterium]
MRKRTPIQFRVVTAAVFVLLVAAAADAQWIACSNLSTTCTNQNVGIGTTSPSTKLDVNGWTGIPGDIVGVQTNIGGDAFFGNTGMNTGRMRVASNVLSGFFQWNIYFNGTVGKSIDNTKPSYEFDMDSNVDAMVFRRYPATSGTIVPTDLLFIGGNGRVGIGTSAPGTTLDVVGTIRATQVVGAVYQDLAEWVPARTKMQPGTVVVLDPTASNQVIPSDHAYDTTVAGVVSANPGIILGEASENKAQIATTGRVRVMVDATAAPVRVGDLLVTSDKQGVAMRSEPIDFNGRKMHQPGTIIGKALEPLPSGQGEILVLLSLQ